MKTLTIRRRQWGVTIQEIYFRYDPNIHSACDLYIYFGVDYPSQYSRARLSHLMDLKHGVNNLVNRFEHHYQQEIELSIKKKDIGVRFSTAPRSQDLQQFCEMYNRQADCQGSNGCDFKHLLFFVGHGSLMLSGAYCQQSGELLGQHLLIGDEQRARVLFSYSADSNHLIDDERQLLVQRAQHVLHWFNMYQLHELNYQWYDFGEPPCRGCVDMQCFGSELRKEYVNFQPLTLKGWLAMSYLRYRRAF